MNEYSLWFRRVMILGFIASNCFAVPGIFQPAAVADLIGVPPPTMPVWLAFAFLLSFLVSWFYIPAAIDPIRNMPTAYLSVGMRFATAGFWLFAYPYFEPGPPPWLWKVDLVFGFVQLILLTLAVRRPSLPTA